MKDQPIIVKVSKHYKLHLKKFKDRIKPGMMVMVMPVEFRPVEVDND